MVQQHSELAPVADLAVARGVAAAAAVAEVEPAGVRFDGRPFVVGGLHELSVRAILSNNFSFGLELVFERHVERLQSRATTLCTAFFLSLFFFFPCFNSYY